MNDGSLWPRINKLIRQLTSIERSLRDSYSRLRALKAADIPGLPIAFMPGSEDDSQDNSFTYFDLYVHGACYGNVALGGADVLVYVPNAVGTFVLSNIFQTNSIGFVRIAVPSYTPNANGSPFTYAYASCVAHKYALTNVELNPNGNGIFTVLLNPTGRYYGTPAALIYGTGSGAAIQGSNILNRGSGYGQDGAYIYYTGGYDTGLVNRGVAGYISDAKVTAGGSGYSGFLATVIPAGSDAKIHGIVSNSGVTSYSINAAGGGYTSEPTITFAAGSPFGNSRLALARGVISGGQLTGVIIDDPGFRYTGSTVSATVSGGRGTGASIAGTISGGAVIAARVANPGKGYYPAPSVSITGGGSGAGISLTAIDGISEVKALRPADVYGCFGTINRGVRLTGDLTSDFGTIDLGFSNRQIGQGSVVWTGTMPNQLFSPAYYQIYWGWYRGGSVVYRYVMSGGQLVGILIDDPGYGHTFSPVYTLRPIVFTQQTYDVPWSGSQSGSNRAMFHFTFDMYGSANGYVIDNAGSGYTPTSGTFNATSVLPVAGEWELFAKCDTTTYSGDGKTYPFGGTVAIPLFGGSGFANRIRPSSYSASPAFTATYDFTGTVFDGVVFQGATSRIVTYDEGTPP